MLLFKQLFELKPGAGRIFKSGKHRKQNLKLKKKKKKGGQKMRTWSSIFVSQHKGCLHNVPVYRLVLTARNIMARRTSFSCV